MRIDSIVAPKLRAQILKYSVAGLALVIASPAIAIAQEAQPADGNVDVIIVTAQKREQRLQDVPVVVTSMSSKVLQSAGVRDIKDMQVLTPGLTVTSTTSEASTTARIRGVGTVGDNPGLESSVGIVIDGVYRARNSVGFGDLGDMERVEVLKGPQGTLFGKNTSAGVINIMTRAPSFDPSVGAEITVGNYNEIGGSINITGPLGGDKVAGSIFAAVRERAGFVDVVTRGPRTETDDQDRNYYTIRGQLLFLPSDGLKMRLIADYSERDENCCAVVQTRRGATAGLIDLLAGGTGAGGTGIAAIADPDNRTAYLNNNTHQNIKDGGISFQLDKDFAIGTLTSISSYRNWETVNGLDIDYTGADIIRRNDNGDYKQKFTNFSEEIRLAGERDNLHWMVGAFYAQEKLDYNDVYVYGGAYEAYFNTLLGNVLGSTFTTNFGNAIPALTGRALGTNFVSGNVAGRDVYSQDTSSWAIFTNESWKVNDKLELTLGLRYSMETKDLDAKYTNPDGAAACSGAIARYTAAVGTTAANPVNPWSYIPTASRPTVLGNVCAFWANPQFAAIGGGVRSESFDDDAFTGTVKAAYHFNDDIMGYASYARGYKSGGYNLDRVLASGLTPATSLRFPGESVDSYEVGLKNSFQGGKLQINITAFHQTFTDFQLNTFGGVNFFVETIPELVSKGIDADVYWRTPIRGLSVQGGLTYADTKYGKFIASDLLIPSHFTSLSLLPGARMSFAPQVSASLSANWAGDIGGLKASWALSTKYMSKYNTGSDLVPYKMQDAYALINGRVGIGSQSGRWTFEVWGNNLADETYYQTVISAPLQGSSFATGATSYNAAADTATYDAFLGAPRTFGATLRLKY